MSTYVCYCLLKGSSGSRGMARRLSELQAHYESICAPELPQQAFVYGDEEAECLPFKTYPKGWRTGLDACMARCRTQDMLALSWRLLEGAMRRQQDADFRLVLLADSTTDTEEESVSIVADQLRGLKGKGLEIIFAACTPEAESGGLGALADMEISAVEDTAFALGGRI